MEAAADGGAAAGMALPHQRPRTALNRAGDATGIAITMATGSADARGNGSMRAANIANGSNVMRSASTNAKKLATTRACTRAGTRTTITTAITMITMIMIAITAITTGTVTITITITTGTITKLGSEA